MKATVCGVLLCALCLLWTGCDSAEQQAQSIQRVLRADRQISEESMDLFPSSTAVEKLRQIDLAGCPAPFREVFNEYIREAEAVLQGPLHRATREQQAKADQQMQATHAEVARVALAYGVAVE